MNFHILTLFPDMVMQGLGTSIIGRAVNNGLLSIEAVNIRDYAFNKHQSVDDYPYGGGAGMLMQAEPVYQAYEAIAEKVKKKPRVVYLSPQGATFSQTMRNGMGKKFRRFFCPDITPILKSGEESSRSSGQRREDRIFWKSA